MVQRKPLISRSTSFIQRQVIKANEKDEDELLQTKEASDGTPALSPSVESHLNNMRGDGQLLPSVRASSSHALVTISAGFPHILLLAERYRRN